MSEIYVNTITEVDTSTEPSTINTYNIEAQRMSCGNVGSATEPVYFENGVPIKCTGGSGGGGGSDVIITPDSYISSLNRSEKEEIATFKIDDGDTQSLYIPRYSSGYMKQTLFSGQLGETTGNGGSVLLFPFDNYEYLYIYIEDTKNVVGSHVVTVPTGPLKDKLASNTALVGCNLYGTLGMVLRFTSTTGFNVEYVNNLPNGESTVSEDGQISVILTKIDGVTLGISQGSWGANTREPIWLREEDPELEENENEEYEDEESEEESEEDNLLNPFFENKHLKDYDFVFVYGHIDGEDEEHVDMGAVDFLVPKLDSDKAILTCGSFQNITTTLLFKNNGFYIIDENTVDDVSYIVTRIDGVKYGAEVKGGGGSDENCMKKKIDYVTAGWNDDGDYDARGEKSTIEGIDNYTYGDGGHSEGWNSYSTGVGSHSEGIGSYAGVGDITRRTGDLGLYPYGGYSTEEYTGLSSHAEGTRTSSLNEGSHSEGYITCAQGHSSHAEGANSRALTNYSHAEGEGTLASQIVDPEWWHDQTLEYDYNNAESYYNPCHAEGRGSSALGFCSHAEGYATLAWGAYSHASGSGEQVAWEDNEWEWNMALGDYSYVGGHKCRAIGNLSHAEGWEIYAAYDSQFVIGRVNDQSFSGPFAIGNGTIHYGSGMGKWREERNIFEVDWNGNVRCENNINCGGNISCSGGIREGLSTSRIGTYAHAEGASTTAAGSSSHAEGYKTYAYADYQTVVGRYNVIDTNSDYAFIVGTGSADNARSNAFGVKWDGTVMINGSPYSPGGGGGGGNAMQKGVDYVTAGQLSGSTLGTGSTAEGHDVVSVGVYSHAEGLGTSICNGSYNHAEGYKTYIPNALDSYEASHVEGYKTTAYSSYAHAEGYETSTRGTASHAEGYNTTAAGMGSHSEGCGTYAKASYQTVVGRYNEIDTNGEYAFLVGTGTGYNDRSNSFGVKWDGTVMINGSAYNPSVTPSLDVEDLDNVIISNIADGQVLKYNNGVWENANDNNTVVVANPNGTATTALTKLQVGNDIYSISSGGGGGGAANLSDLNDVTIDSSLASGQVLQYDGSKWVNATAGGGGGNYMEKGVDYVTAGQKAYATLGTKATAEGTTVVATGNSSHAEGSSTTAYGSAAHAEGANTCAYNNYSHTEGQYTYAIGTASHAGGTNTTASKDYSFAHGYRVKAGDVGSMVIGHGNLPVGGAATTNNTQGYAFVIGNGTNNSYNNCFKITYTGTIEQDGGIDAGGNITTTGTVTATQFIPSSADYAEYFEWADGNIEEEDRVGHFVTFDEENENQIRIATSEDDYILGIVSGIPSILANGDSNVWTKIHLRDDFNRIIYEDALVYTYDEEGNKIPAVDENGDQIYKKQPKINPEYDETQEYISRGDRAEWDAIGMLGALSVIDDGTCVPGKYCKVANDGTATYQATYNKNENYYRVLKRISDNVVQVLLK